MRKLWVLISRLPRESRVIRGEVPDAAWTIGEHLLARLVDEVAAQTWVTATIHSKNRPPKPKPLPRPGDRERASERPKGGLALMSMLGGNGG